MEDGSAREEVEALILHGPKDRDLVFTVRGYNYSVGINLIGDLDQSPRSERGSIEPTKDAKEHSQKHSWGIIKPHRHCAVRRP